MYPAVGGEVGTFKSSPPENMMDPDAPSPPRRVLPPVADTPTQSSASTHGAATSASGASCCQLHVVGSSTDRSSEESEDESEDEDDRILNDESDGSSLHSEERREQVDPGGCRRYFIAEEPVRVCPHASVAWKGGGGKRA